MTLTAHMPPGTARDRAMVRAYLAGVPVCEISPCATSNGQLYRALQRAGVTERRSERNPDWWALVERQHKAGVSIKRMAGELRVTRRAVQYALSRMGLR